MKNYTYNHILFIVLVPKEFQSNSSQFTEDHVKIILSETNHVLFEEMKFEGNTEDYYDVNNSYINKVFLEYK